MWHPWKALPTGWQHVMRMVLVAVVLVVSACTATGRSKATPAAPAPGAAQAGPEIPKDGGGY